VGYVPPVFCTLAAERSLRTRTRGPGGKVQYDATLQLCVLKSDPMLQRCLLVPDEEDGASSWACLAMRRSAWCHWCAPSLSARQRWDRSICVGCARRDLRTSAGAARHLAASTREIECHLYFLSTSLATLAYHANPI
jgi:hypothetical protein